MKFENFRRFPERDWIPAVIEPPFMPVGQNPIRIGINPTLINPNPIFPKNENVI